MKKMKLMFLLLIMVSFPVLVLGQEKPNLVLKLTAQKEVIVKDEEGKTRIDYLEVEKTDPGDVLKYTILYTNAGVAEARGAVIVDPLPAGTTYVGNSAEGKDTEISFSIDGKAFEAPPMLKYKVKEPDGTEKELVATPEMYTHIKWKLKKLVPPGTSGTANFKVKVK